MEIEKLRSVLKKEILQLDGELLKLTSMFIFNWTEGSWTPPPPTKEQIAEIKKRSEEVKRGEVELIDIDEFWNKLREKYGYVREHQENYQAEREEEKREKLATMLEELNRDHLLWLDIFVGSHKSKSGWDSLPEEAKSAALRGKEDAKEGRFTDAFEFLQNHG